MNFLVPEVGLEPTHLSIMDFESIASTSSAIRANLTLLHYFNKHFLNIFLICCTFLKLEQKNWRLRRLCELLFNLLNVPHKDAPRNVVCKDDCRCDVDGMIFIKVIVQEFFKNCKNYFKNY